MLAILGAAFATIFVQAMDGNSSKSSETQSRATTSLVVPGWVWIALLGLGAAVIGILAWFLVQKYRAERAESAARLEEAKRERDAIELAMERLREKMALPSLVELNRIMLDQYHGIATDQAAKSYRSSQRAMWLGFSALVVSFFSALAVQQPDFRIAAAVFGASGSALAAFLSRTYLRVYERSLEQLNRYFNQPLLNSYYLTAERLAEGLGANAKNEATREIVRHLLRETVVVGEARILPPRKSRRKAASSVPDGPAAPPAGSDG
jgi:hypothetical protein